jgi:hypothetical protein
MKYLILKNRKPIDPAEVNRGQDFSRFIQGYKKPQLLWFSLNILAIMFSIPTLLLALSSQVPDEKSVTDVQIKNSLQPLQITNVIPKEENNPSAPTTSPEPRGEFRDGKALTLRKKEDQVLKVSTALSDSNSYTYREYETQVLDIPAPVAYVCDIMSGSKIDKWDFSRKNSLSVWDLKSKKNLPVIAFTIIRSSENRIDTLRTKGDKFSLSMRETIYAMKPGEKLLIPDIVYLSSDGIPLTLHGSEVTIVDNRKKIGEK